MPSFFSELPSVANIVSTSSEQVGQAWAAISPVLVLLAVPVALVMLGLIVWAVKSLLGGSYNIFTGKDRFGKTQEYYDKIQSDYEFNEKLAYANYRAKHPKP